MADVENPAVKKGICSWLLCAGGCKRKVIRKKEKPLETKIKTPSRFGASWSCIRCLMKRKDSHQNQHGYKEGQQENGTAQADVDDDDGLLDLVSKVQSRRLDDQRCPFPVDTANKAQAAESSQSFEEVLEMVARYQNSRLNDQRTELPRIVGTSQKAKHESSGSSPSVPEVLKVRNLDQLNVITTLGTGAFARVDLVTLKDDPSKSFALKAIARKNALNIKWRKRVSSEENIMKGADCPFIARMYCTFRDSRNVYMLMEVCLGADLHTLLYHCGFFDKIQARFYTGCVILALDYLHGKGIAHRDIKPENLLVDSCGYVKLGDFGTAKQTRNQRMMRSDTGTPNYQAPEIFVKGQYDLTVDLWSLGVTMYQFLSGDRPFGGFDPRFFIVEGFDAHQFSPLIDREAEDIIRRLCRLNVDERKKDVSDIKNHEWFKEFDWDELALKRMPPPFDPKVTGPTDCHNFY